MSLEESCETIILGHIDMERNWESAVILQGPYSTHTSKAIDIFLRRNSNLIVIVSTYKGEQTSDIDKKLSEHEESRLIFILNKMPDRQRHPDFWKTNHWNQNLQRLTSYFGLRLAEELNIEFSLKIRSDSFLGKENVTAYLISEYISKYPIEETSKFKGRIAVSEFSKKKSENTHFPQICDHDISDFWFFGHTSDVLRYFDCSAKSSWDEGRGMSTQTFPESNQSELWMKDSDIPLETDILELFTKYFCVPSTVDIEFVWLKRWHPNFELYLREGKDLVSRHYHEEKRHWKLISHERWFDLITSSS
jgi:hypothetical protein